MSNILDLDLISVQTVCEGYQEMTKVAACKARVKRILNDCVKELSAGKIYMKYLVLISLKIKKDISP